jgi:small subunit ribosomal protein S13
MVLLLNTNIKDVKSIFVSLKSCYGISNKNSLCLVSKFGLSLSIRYKNLPDYIRSQIELNIDKIVENILRLKIGRILKHEEAYFFEKLNTLKCYRSLRHKQYLPVRGQRTHSNAKTQKKKLKNRLKFLKVKK